MLLGGGQVHLRGQSGRHELKFERLLMPMRRFPLALVFVTRDTNLKHQVLALAPSYVILQKPEQIFGYG